MQTAAPPTPAAPASPRQIARALGSVMIGNWFELFDFIVYGYFAAQIGQAMFPKADPLTAILASFATYGVGFVMRPVGAVVLGSFGDRRGRKAALVLTMLLMAVATGLTGLIPSYATIGLAAPLLLVACRLVQGFATGGEWGGATTFLVEYAPPHRRGFFGSLQQLSTSLAIVSAIGTALLLNAILSPQDLAAWGWRVPFVLGFLVAPVGFWLRAHVSETPAFEAEAAVPAAPVREALTVHRAAVARVFGITIVWTVGSYIFTTFTATFASQTLKIPASEVLAATLLGVLVNIATIPIVGWLSDRYGRWPFLIASAVGCLLLSLPLYWQLATFATAWNVAILTSVAGVLTGLYSGAAPTFLCELLPTRIRYTAMSIGYNGAVMIFGGFGPFIATLLVQQTGTAIAPGFYVTGAAALSAIALLLTPRRPALHG
ncbi:MFS transporter [Caulobacter segnis]|uniref:MFS transporter n=1 Tax=Caulobacter segnis TaxID=88688 RepID=UPI00240EB7C9|nr:MFS transporter [Caulobacter segnis]MDG2522922.1 MFS transporter [Caulobacter segnis]